MTSSGEHAIEQCIQEAFGQDGGLAQVFLQAFRSTFVEPLNTKLNELTFRNLIKRKNPYLYHASGLTTIEELVERAFNDFVSSSTEGRFGKFLELLAVSLPGNIKSSAAGVDIERRYPDHVELFAVKSGPAGYNSSSWQTQQGQLSAARTRLQQGGHNTIAYTGPAYGRKRTTVDKRHGIVRLSSRDL